MKSVYLIKNTKESTYKVGISKHPQQRLKENQTGNSSLLELIHSYPSKYASKIETALHNRYSYLREEGEWFDFSIKEEVSFIKNCKKIEKNIKFLSENGNVFI